MIDCSCPGKTALDTIEYNPCVNKFGKYARFVFQRLDDSGNSFVNGVNGIEEAASWTTPPLADATDSTKIVITPILEDVNFSQPDVLEDSENLDGAPIVIDSGPQVVTAIIRNPTPAQFEAIRQLGCEQSLTFYGIDNNGKFRARQTSDSPVTHAGIKISDMTFIATDPAKAGTRVDQDKLQIQFTLPAAWFGDSAVVNPEAGFNPLTDIKPS